MATSLSQSSMRRTLSRSTLRRGLVQHRAASTAIPPESPRYVDIPRPPQQLGVEPPPVKGVLPRPRNIFHNEKMQKDSEEYLERVNPRRTAERPVPAAEHQEATQHKERITELRKQHLRDGIQQLRQRQIRITASRLNRTRQKQNEHKHILAQPARDSDVLTQPSIRKIETESLRIEMSPEEIQARKEQLDMKEAAKAEERRVNMHTLYMNARDFIVTEEQLNKRVDEVFDEPHFNRPGDPSIWSKEGIPEMVSDLLEQSQFKSDRAISSTQSFSHLTRQRLQRIAEELTGGKMEDGDRQGRA